MTIYVLSGFNNYYNRQVKKFDTLEQYTPYLLHTQENYNFVPNDNVNTQVVLGNVGNQYTGQGDYLLVVDELNQIVSRWFVIESARDRAGQYTLTLHRDLVADHLNELIDAPIYVEKATLDERDPFIFNSENLTLNQIKTKEYQIKDKSDCAWLVGYLSRNNADYGPYNLAISNTLYNEEMTQSEWEALVREASDYTVSNGYYFTFKSDWHPTARSAFIAVHELNSDNTAQWNFSCSQLTTLPDGTSSFSGGLSSGNVISIELNKLPQLVNQQILEIAKMAITSPIIDSRSKFNEYLSYNGKIVKVLQSDGITYKYYKISSTRKNGPTVSHSITSDMGEIDNIKAIPTYITQYLTKSPYVRAINTFQGKILRKSLYIDFTYEEVSSIEIKDFTIPSTRRQLQDAPYDMFCIPYKEDGLDFHIHLENYDVLTKTIGKVETMSFAQQLAEKLGKNLLDIQLLPFCPLQGWNIDRDGRFTITDTGMESGKDFLFKYVLNGLRSIVVFYSSKSEGEINYEQLNIVDNETGEKVIGALPTTQSVKMSNQCDMYRLCSPNWNGQFEFNPAKCGIDTWYQFNVDYTYLPYSPYIKINPNFSQLYGKDFDDARGLICQGDFSISYMSDQWVNYQVQNKNYQNVFDRGTKNLEKNHEINRTKQVTEGIINSVGVGVGTGLKTGSVAKGLTSGIASALGTAADVAFNEALHNEAMDYRQDLFNYSLDNIQALPDSIAKVTAYTKSNRIFPTLEYYTCTDAEKRALANKIAYNGMTTMRIGTIGEFVGNNWSYGDIESKGYIKGKLIRLETVEDDYHLVNALSGELDKGVFIK